MGSSGSKGHNCGLHDHNCKQNARADYDWRNEKAIIDAFYDAIPDLYEASLLDALYRDRSKDIESYMNQLRSGLKDYIKLYEDQYDETLKEYQNQYTQNLKAYQDSIDEFVKNGSKSCDDITSSPEFKQKQQDVKQKQQDLVEKQQDLIQKQQDLKQREQALADLKIKQSADAKALQKMNFENLHKDEVDKALRKLALGDKNCDMNTAEYQDQLNQDNIEDDVEEEFDEDYGLEEEGEEDEDEDMDGGNMPEIVYQINKNYVMHNKDESPLKKIKNIR
jgi:hypothetical protein